MATRYYTLNTETTPATLSPLALPIAVDGRFVVHPTPAQAAQFDAYPRADGLYRNRGTGAFGIGADK